MKRLFIISAIGTAMLIVLSSSWASINLNSSRSGVYRIVSDANVVSQAQGDALAKALDKQGPLTEAKAKAWMVSNFKVFGIDGTRVKVIKVLLEQQVRCAAPETCKGKYFGPAQQAAEATTVKGSKSNGSERLSGVCFCYGSITAPAQVQQVSKESPIVIFLLSDPAQEADAFKTTINTTKSNSY